jgi:hypothetical protein
MKITGRVRRPTQQNNNNSSSNGGSTSGPIEFVPVGPVIHEQGGTTDQNARLTVNNRIIITAKRGR